MKPIRIGLLGCGTVGGGVIQLLAANAEYLASRVGAPLEVARVLVLQLLHELGQALIGAVDLGDDLVHLGPQGALTARGGEGALERRDRVGVLVGLGLRATEPAWPATVCRTPDPSATAGGQTARPDLDVSCPPNDPAPAAGCPGRG